MTRRRRRDQAAATAVRRLRPRIHPVGWITPVVGSGVAMVAWAGVAHSSGSGWVQAVGALLAAVLVVGMVAPAASARRGGVVCAVNPADTEVGGATVLTLAVDGPLRLRAIAPSGPVSFAGGPASGPRTVDVEIRPRRRGVLDTVAFEVATSAPFGLLWWARELEVALARPLHVAPRSAPGASLDLGTDDPPGSARERVPGPIGEPRGVRPYVSGDHRRTVHWPVTSHTGSLMVRESERPRDEPVRIDVVLPSDPELAEHEAERAMGRISAALGWGLQVILGTDEPDGHVTGWVRDRTDLGRRLARAVAPTHHRRPVVEGGP